MAKTEPAADWQQRINKANDVCRKFGLDIEPGIIDFGDELEKPTVRFIGYGCEVPDLAKREAIQLLPDFDVSFDALD
jgi:hypothetical protein